MQRELNHIKVHVLPSRVPDKKLYKPNLIIVD